MYTRWVGGFETALCAHRIRDQQGGKQRFQRGQGANNDRGGRIRRCPGSHGDELLQAKEGLSVSHADAVLQAEAIFDRAVSAAHASSLQHCAIVRFSPAYLVCLHGPAAGGFKGRATFKVWRRFAEYMQRETHKAEGCGRQSTRGVVSIRLPTCSQHLQLGRGIEQAPAK